MYLIKIYAKINIATVPTKVDKFYFSGKKGNYLGNLKVTKKTKRKILVPENELVVVLFGFGLVWFGLI